MKWEKRATCMEHLPRSPLISLFQRNDFSTDHYEDFSATTSALKRVVWPAAAASSGSLAAADQTEGRQRHRSSSQQRARRPSGAGAVDRPMEWIGQQQREKERRGESAERIERDYEMEIQKKAWDAHHSESYYRMSR